MIYSSRPSHYLSLTCGVQDGYTLEEIDVYGLVNGHEQVVIPKVSRRHVY